DFEVVFAASGGPAAPPQHVSSEVESLRRQVEEIRQMLACIAPGALPRGAFGAVANALMETGVDAETARRVEAAARQRASRRTVPRAGGVSAEPGLQDLFQAAAEEISASFAVAPEIGRVTALVGPPGCGKTTTLVKLAIAHGLARGRTVRLISTDTQRIGGSEQLRTYAAILGMPFELVESAPALGQAIDSAPASAMLLIDTPGLSPALLPDLGGDLAGLLSERQEIDTHLVLTASMRLEDLYRTAALYESFRPAKLLFTKVDETSTLAATFCAASRLQLPASFFSIGQSVPEDLEAASPAKVVASLVRQLPSPLEAAA
ncbi:MAG TPA: hypothetical protein VMU19_08790, partial [Bryobacteraceae bacterium]|nr:hypothetical protein [Bryobacteraceae bacterium]